ncbi:MAG TPA: MarR family transcriptional regulator [Candidatus Angelobacter sp.]
MLKEKEPVPLQDAEYIALAEFRYRLRKFQHHMEEQVRTLGVNPQQYQLLLAVKGLPRNQTPTIGRLAERMQLNHNSMVELVDRSARSGLLRRGRSGPDRRLVSLSITAEGEGLLRKLGNAAREELRGSGPSLIDAIRRLTRNAKPGKPARTRTKLRRGASEKAGP